MEKLDDHRFCRTQRDCGGGQQLLCDPDQRRLRRRRQVETQVGRGRLLRGPFRGRIV